MSAENHDFSSTATETHASSSKSDNIMRDIVLWRRKKLSATILLAITATWVVMEVYQFNFLTVISWVAMFVVAPVFIWANMLRLLGKETPDMSNLEVTEAFALETANSVRAWIEEGIRWMFQVSAEKEWFVFVGVVAGLGLLSYVGNCFDFLTFIFIGTMLGMTVPVIYVKQEDKIKSFMERLKAKCRSSYEVVDEKVIKKITNRIAKEKEEKKTE
ncbi:Reticulon-like protein [Quillaja saponaria]|uniref:Reticulon-like protein n=1 Tax=Quillaja saponaria TaxID=32244 RepID=A0AAD7L7Z7_QUISA|nr:Reticulon-like protein [Quillaja saponaria]